MSRGSWCGVFEPDCAEGVVDVIAGSTVDVLATCTVLLACVDSVPARGREVAAGLLPLLTRTVSGMIICMERVTGIGGVFFRSKDPEALGRWYADHLGVQQPPTSYDERSWEQEAGPTVFTALPSDSAHFRSAGQQWSVNFRVRDLDAMIAQLRGAGIQVDEHVESYPNGRFAELVDPDGTPIQLWEPAGADTVK